MDPQIARAVLEMHGVPQDQIDPIVDSLVEAVAVGAPPVAA
jgi:hypothetical protein